MVSLNTNNSKVDPGDQEKFLSELKPYIEYLRNNHGQKNYTVSESSIDLPSDKEYIQKITLKYERKKLKKLKYMFLVGIGGSNLGTKAIYEAIFGRYDGLWVNEYPRIVFVETLTPEFFAQIEKLMDQKEIKSKKDFLINIVSKSGETTESIVNADLLIQTLSKKFKSVESRIVITTDKDSKLYELGTKQKIATFTIPKMVGGRFSVFSTVGLLPLYLSGVDTTQLLKGAEDAVKDNLEFDYILNKSVQSAIAIFQNYQNGKTIYNEFLFDPNLESLGKWYRQLMGESIGKEIEKNRERVGIGITPIVSIGSTDLHSVAQLYIGGPKDKFTNFVWVDKSENIYKASNSQVASLVQGVEGKSAFHILKIIYEGTKKAFEKRDMPFIESNFTNIDEYQIGYYMQMKMIEMMYLGFLLKVNTFDQPNVEEYKEYVRKFL